jgi:hypothetical protein
MMLYYVTFAHKKNKSKKSLFGMIANKDFVNFQLFFLEHFYSNVPFGICSNVIQERIQTHDSSVGIVIKLAVIEHETQRGVTVIHFTVQLSSELLQVSQRSIQVIDCGLKLISWQFINLGVEGFAQCLDIVHCSINLSFDTAESIDYSRHAAVQAIREV